MKFRGVMIDTIPMREFTIIQSIANFASEKLQTLKQHHDRKIRRNLPSPIYTDIVTTLSKISKECTLRLTSDNVYFIVTDDGYNTQPPKVWCQLDRSSFFSEYLMEGVDDTHKDIYLGCGTGNLARSLVSLKQTAKCIKIKLTNKQSPCLTLEIELPSLNMEHMRQVTHDVPVTVIPRKAWETYKEPVVQNYHVSIVMPALKQLRSTVDRMKNMSSEVILKADASGQFVMQIKTDLATVSSRFRNLEVVKFYDADKDNDDDDDNDDGFIVCRIDIKKFAMFLSADQINHSKVLCSMSHGKMVNLFIDNEGILNFQCFIPSISY